MSDSAWGPWKLNERTLELELDTTDVRGMPVRYRVDLERCTTAGQVLDWIAQVAKKVWADPYVLAGLVHALDAVLQIQGRLCPNGGSRSPLTPQQIRELVRRAADVTASA